MRARGGQCSRFISNNTICAPPLLPQGGLQRALQDGFRTAKNRLLGLWGASGVSGPLLETFSGFLWLHLWSWGLSGVVFGGILGPLGLLFKLFGPPWPYLLQKFGHNFCLTCKCIIKTRFLFACPISLKKLGRPNFPEVVSSCYRAGYWEWV